MYIGKKPQIGNYQTCDSISATATDTFNLTVGNVAVSPISAHHCLVSLNGILQAPISSYTIVGSTIVFASALTTSDSIDFITILGNTLDTGTPSDGTVTNAKLAQDIISGETALTTPPATTDEFLVSDAGTLKRIDFSLLGNTPAWYVKLSGNQTIGASGHTKVTWDSEVFDTASAFASNKFTVPANQGGKYFVYHSVMIDDLDDGEFVQLNLYKNGSEQLNYQISEKSMASGFNITAQASGIIDLSATDYLESYVYQNSSGNQVAQYEVSRFIGYKLIGA